MSTMDERERARNLESLQKFRSYLVVLARGCVPRDVQARIGESDIVAQVLLRAVQDFGAFRGKTDRQWKAYLRKLLAHALVDAMRAMRRQARDPRREQQMRARLEDTDVRLESLVEAQLTSGPAASERNELRERVLEVVAELPAEQYYVIEQRRLRGRPTKAIAAELGKSEGAVRKLEARGFQTLRRRLGKDDEA